MPRKMENALRKYARKVGAKRGSKRYDAIVFGTMNEKGLLHNRRRGIMHGRTHRKKRR